MDRLAEFTTQVCNSLNELERNRNLSLTFRRNHRKHLPCPQRRTAKRIKTRNRPLVNRKTTAITIGEEIGFRNDVLRLSCEESGGGSVQPMRALVVPCLRSSRAGFPVLPGLYRCWS